jgi:cell division protein FtsQ
LADRRPRQRPREGPHGLWDRPALLGAIADVLLVLGSAGIAYAFVLGALRLPIFPLRELVVVTPMKQVTGAQLAYAARSSLAGNFFTVNLDHVRATFEKLPWVRHAEVRRRWPGTLELEVEEHRAAAYWRAIEAGETRLVDEYGEVFVAASNAKLPVFAGPEGSAPLLLERYREFSETVAPLGRSLDRLILSPRLAWQLKLDDGMVIELGHDEPKAPVAERLARFVGVYAQAAQGFGQRVAVADLRYPNGFALRPAQGS